MRFKYPPVASSPHSTTRRLSPVCQGSNRCQSRNCFTICMLRHPFQILGREVDVTLMRKIGSSIGTAFQQFRPLYPPEARFSRNVWGLRGADDAPKNGHRQVLERPAATPTSGEQAVRDRGSIYGTYHARWLFGAISRSCVRDRLISLLPGA